MNDNNDDYIKKLIKRDTPIRVVHTKRNARIYKDAYLCPVCGKIQKDTYKNIKKGCYCERCGQSLMW